MQKQSGPGAGVVAVLVALLGVAGASGWYAADLRTKQTALAEQLAAAERQLAPVTAAARKAFPTDDQTTALRRFTERLDACVATVSVSAKRTIAPEKRQAMIDVLRGETAPERTVWFEVNPNTPGSTAFLEVVGGAFREAGWAVKTKTTPGIALKPGLFFMVAEEFPPPWVETVQKAFDAAGLEVKAARGYRAFYQQQKAEKPGWSGVEMAPDQQFAVIIGPDA